jgi:dynein heavy chain 2, cytosolic
MLESHELMIKEQVDMLKNAIETRTQIFMADVEKFSLRWNQLKPRASDLKNLENADNAIRFIKDQAAELANLNNVKQQLIADYNHFGSVCPEFSLINEIEGEIQASQGIWLLCEEYTRGLEDIAKQDWISFRGKIGSLEDYFILWNDRIGSRKIDTIATHIIKDMDSYRQVIPVLKFLRGDNWMSEHWGEMFRILQFPKGTTLSELTVKHFLDVGAELSVSIEKIKDLNSRANGEIAIRDALHELEIWGASATFSVSEYTDAKGQAIQVIKEWKEILTQVGDNQSLLQSLKDSPYFKNFADKTSIWERKLSDLDFFLRQLNSIQRKWVYLEPIFSRGSLPSESSRFARIDEEFRGIVLII